MQALANNKGSKGSWKKPQSPSTLDARTKGLKNQNGRSAALNRERDRKRLGEAEREKKKSRMRHKKFAHQKEARGAKRETETGTAEIDRKARPSVVATLSPGSKKKQKKK